jgi:hypothetical protein
MTASSRNHATMQPIEILPSPEEVRRLRKGQVAWLRRLQAKGP